MNKYRETLRLHSLGISQRSIAASCQCSTKTISKILKRAKELAIAWPLPEDTTDEKLDEQFFPKQPVNSNRRYPDMAYIHKELARNGVSLKLLWNEYCEECRLNGELPFMYTQFCYHYQKYAMHKNASMHMLRKPGDSVEVDWAGNPAHIIDRDTGEITNVYIFVGVLSYSQYAYVEAYKNENLESWIAAHNHMYRFFGGVPRMTIPDNLRTGVVKAAHHYEDPLLNKTYHEMAEHYNTAVMPARIRKPKDKPNAEGAVKLAGQWIIAALRNMKFFTLAELNHAIECKLCNYNEKPFQQKPGCRRSVFLEEEKAFLAPLPTTSYELSLWEKATVGFNYHIFAEGNYYSCPHEYIKCSVDVRLTKSIVEIFYKNHRIASHPRITGKLNHYSTLAEHMPEDHKQYLQWDAPRFILWAEKIGANTTAAIKSILASRKVEQQAYRSCMGLLQLSKKYSHERLETACEKALSYSANTSLKSIKSILETQKDVSETVKSEPNYGYVRGAEYYGRLGNHDE